MKNKQLQIPFPADSFSFSRTLYLSSLSRGCHRVMIAVHIFTTQFFNFLSSYLFQNKIHPPHLS